MTREERVLDIIKTKAKEILPPGYRIRLFGSRARGDAHDLSDWDIHILINGEEHLSSAIRSELAYPIEELGWEMGEDINILMHTYKGWEKRSFLPLYKNIEKEGVDL